MILAAATLLCLDLTIWLDGDMLVRLQRVDLVGWEVGTIITVSLHLLDLGRVVGLREAFDQLELMFDGSTLLGDLLLGTTRCQLL